MSSLTDRLSHCYVSAVHDVLRKIGHSNCVLPPTIRAFNVHAPLAGEIYTLSGHVDQTLSRHESLLRWSRVLSRVPSGRVLVCQPNTKAVALMGELSARALMVKNTLGYVVDGHIRDAGFLQDMAFPIYCELTTPADIVERWAYDQLGKPITIGSITISSGDYLIADRDGVVIIPNRLAEEVISETEQVISTESDMRDAILSGMDPEQAYLKFRKF